MNPCFLPWDKPVNVYLWMESGIYCDQTWCWSDRVNNVQWNFRTQLPKLSADHKSHDAVCVRTKSNEIFYFWKILVVHCKWKAFDICCTLCILRLIISFVPVSRQNFRSQTMKYSSNGCTVHFNIYNGKDAAKGMSKFGLGHDVKVRLISPYFDQCWRNMCNYHISDLLFSNQFLWRCCLYDKEPF